MTRAPTSHAPDGRGSRPPMPAPPRPGTPDRAQGRRDGPRVRPRQPTAPHLRTLHTPPKSPPIPSAIEAIPHQPELDPTPRPSIPSVVEGRTARCAPPILTTAHRPRSWRADGPRLPLPCVPRLRSGWTALCYSSELRRGRANGEGLPVSQPSIPRVVEAIPHQPERNASPHPSIPSAVEGRTTKRRAGARTRAHTGA